MKDNYFYKKPLSNIHKKPNAFSEVTSQILYGEKFKIISKNKNWIKIKVSFDNYTGYIKNKYYTKDHQPTHKIFTLKANIYNKQKNKTKNFLPFASRISMINENKKFVEFEKDKWIKKKDIKKINHIEKDYLKVLKMFLKIKYLWGGKTYRGIDCSAILQLFFYYNNKFYPRDTKDQIKYSAKKNKSKVFKKGDIIFWKGHVGICLNQSKFIHAYGPRKKVLIMPVNYSIRLIEKTAKLVVKKICNIQNF